VGTLERLDLFGSVRLLLMATVLMFGEQIQVFMSLGFVKDAFTLNTSQLNGTDVLDGDDTDDIAEYVESLSISRGRSDQFTAFRAGTLTLVLNNNDRRFDPINESSPYWNSTIGKSGVQPRRQVQVVADNIPLFTGRVTDIDVAYDFQLSTVTITASDDFTLLANAYTEAATTPPSELSGARVSRILDLPEIGYPLATRNIGTGVATLGAYQIPENTSAAAYLARVAEAEQGLFFVAADGTLTFTDRATTAFASPVESFVDQGVGLPYQSLSTVVGQEFLYNRVQTQTETGAVQVAEDTQSQADFGISTLTLSDLLLASDADALDLADQLLSFYKQPDYRFDELRVLVSAFDSIDRAGVLNIEMGDVVGVVRSFDVGSPASVTKEYGVDRITHTITPSTHTVTLGLFDALIVFPLILNDAEFGRLDERNAVT
jgi:hypothetical protein